MHRKHIYLLVATVGAAIFALIGGVYYYLWIAPQDWFVPPTRMIELSHEEMEIYEAVLRYQIFHSAAGGRGTASAFVMICDQNPSKAFLKRFESHSPSVDSAQRFRGSLSVLYILGPIDRASDDIATVSGGYYEGSQSASGNTYHLIRIDGIWKVVKDEMHWIS
jgi:hypothetical protein